MKNRSESGNILWFILVAIVLLGVLTMILSRSGSTVGQSGDVEQNRIRASQIIRTAKGIETAINQMILRGMSENQISFANTETAADYTNAGCTTTDCLVFDAGGGGQTYADPPSGTNDGSEWIFTGANNVGTAAGPVGTTAAGSGNDLVMLMPGINEDLCIQINRDLSVGTAGTIPEDETGIDDTVFTGTYAAALSVIDGDATPFELDGHEAGCFTDTGGASDVRYFYYVLLAR